ncbi:MAG: Rossmann-like and DUF2520 domain-containing protein [Planctomycetota bacterium]|nr:Rossmann-like and DUF2520 domain-containing protein [Planctomycetota bacterium]
MAELPDISIIGPGKVGTAIGMLAVRAGLRVAAVAGQNLNRAKTAAANIGLNTWGCMLAEAAAAGGLILLTVPDDAVRSTCEELAKNSRFAKGAVVAHCSGALGSDVLQSAREACGCAVGSMHPLQTFPTLEAAVEKLPDAYFFIEGDEPATNALTALAEAISGHPMRIESENKPLYHAAAVCACNYLPALLDVAMKLSSQAGIERQTAMAAFEPLVRATVDNVFDLGVENALTGPAERGDVETVGRHLSALRDCDERLVAAYKAMGRLTVDLARKKGTIDASTAERLTELLERPTTIKE